MQHEYDDRGQKVDQQLIALFKGLGLHICELALLQLSVMFLHACLHTLYILDFVWFGASYRVLQNHTDPANQINKKRCGDK